MTNKNMTEEVLSTLCMMISGDIERDDMVIAAEEITQMFCDNLYRWMSIKYEDIYTISEFTSLIKQNIIMESKFTGFTEQQIINSLEKLKNGNK